MAQNLDSMLNKRLNGIEQAQKQLANQIINLPSAQTTSSATYASVAAKSDKVRVPTGKMITQVIQTVVVVNPKNKEDKVTGDQIQEMLTKNINPKQLGLKLDKVVKVWQCQD